MKILPPFPVITILLLSCSWSMIRSQCQFTITLESQEEVDDFPVNYPGCTYWEGTIFVTGSSIIDLSPLGQLDSIDELLFYFNDNLPSLAGLEGLVYVRNLTLFTNPLLQDFTGLDNLEEIAGTFNLNGDESLVSLNGLGNLGFIDTLFIQGGFTPANFNGLNSLDSLTYWLISACPVNINFTGIPTGLKIHRLRIENSAILGFNGLNGVERIDELSLHFLSDLNSFVGLSGLTVMDRLELNSCNALTDFGGLEGLQRVGTLQVFTAFQLTSFTGLSSLQTIDDFILGDLGVLSNFNGLSSLDSITQVLDMNSCNLTSFTGLSNVSYINGVQLHNLSLVSMAGFPPITKLRYLMMGGCFNLTSLAGLELLTSIGRLELYSMAQLGDLTGLENVTRIDSIRLYQSDGLLSTSGLQNLDTLHTLRIYQNPQWTEFVPMPGVRKLRTLQVSQNSALDTLSAFPGLDSISHDVNVFLNGSLTSMTRFDSLTHIGGHLSIEGNPNLDSISMISLADIAGNVVISQNPLLDDCCFLNDVHIGGDLTLTGNTGSCRDLFHLQQDCPDGDQDGIDERIDNCPGIPNAFQGDQDVDGIGDACDNCPMVANPGQEDVNDNHIGDACEVPETGKIGINEVAPDAGLHINNADVFYDSLLRGIIMTSSSGNCFRLLVNDEGNLYTIPISCPE